MAADAPGMAPGTTGEKGFSERLKQAMDARSMTAAVLSSETGVHKSTLSQYLSGLYEPKHDRIVLFAQALRCNPQWLEGKGGEMFINADGTDDLDPAMTHKLPVYANAAAFADEKPERNVIGHEYAEECFCDKRYFYLLMNDDSMAPVLCAGDRLLCECRDELEDDDIGVFIVGDTAVVRCYSSTAGGITLYSPAPRIGPRIYSGFDTRSVRVVAKVIQLTREL